MFRIAFLRNIFLLALALAIVLPLVDILVIQPSYQELLIEETEDDAVRFARYLTRTLHLDQRELAREGVPESIADEVTLVSEDEHLIKLRVFSSAARIVYSTDAGEIGKLNDKGYFRNIVARGGNYSKVVKKDGLTADSQKTQIDVVETYVPIMAGNRFKGAIEVYYDITENQVRIQTLFSRSTGTLCLIAAGLLLTTIWVLFRTKKLYLAQQAAEEALRRNNEELEDRVAERTVRLSEEVEARLQKEQVLRRLLDEVAEAHGNMDAILQSVDDALLVINDRQEVELMNAAAARLLNVPAEEAEGRAVSDIVDDAGLKAHILSVLDGEGVAPPFDFSLSAAPETSGRIYQGRTSMVCYRDDCRESGTILLIQDVTGEREVDRLRNEFLAMVAHELGTPLTAVMGYSELLAGQGVKGFPEELVDEMLVTVHQEADRLSRIVDDLLDISRLGGGQHLAMRKESFLLNEVIDGAVEQLRTRKELGGIEVDIPSGPVEMNGDADRIRQVLCNLLSNAVKYSPVNETVRVVMSCKDGVCEVTVADSGIGMSPEQLARVFEKFYRVDSSNTATRGTGLGLCIAKHIIEAHGGDIWIESRPHHGTTVHFVLPVDGEEASLGSVGGLNV